MCLGPGGVSELRYRSSDSTALWAPSISGQQDVVYLYQLSLESGSAVESSRVSDSELPLPGLEAGKPYILDVWEECHGLWESEPSRLYFKGANLTSGVDVRGVVPLQTNGQYEVALTLSMFCGK